MKWKKLLSLRQWSHVFRRIPRLITSSRIPLGEKLLFAVPVLLYWILPDVMPFMPIDDIGVTLLLMNWFVTRAERKYPDVIEKQHVRVR
ncbi:MULTISPECIES: hypothetical protein [Paenibacillus]|jgi:hypothetical protein|uniref:DUF1232 domain-containing protein n=1 Tax=Paenibacillus polymyxa TaxID=1406 RepID=A0A378XY94_PAEPO|nr:MULTISPECIES: hypothetical protein [Paenibacillus]AUS25969.1 hypothetical protein C1A50_1795 [Paenibacillus polymyxa]KAE8559948.1 hypothetical protein BJH92_11625 [Paenibacillus polymyxa]KAF6582661.1 hypothetical protein G9G57_17290 [Paenibacillus sp. EKM211P]KAF6619074.1 hypothetical protein HFE00_07105 [Paenibacillus sp. EKM101P]KAF6624165.1 hypothetical protein HFE03_00965 [Paenibacillus sp. EKM102P]